MVRAIWKDKVIAESEDTVYVEGNHYFSRDSVDVSLLRNSDRTTHCSWKGTANYYTLAVDGDEIEDAAWYYAEPKEAASQIGGRVAFWRGVRVIDMSQEED